MKNDLIYKISLFALVLVLVLPLVFIRIATVDSEHIGIKYDKRIGEITQCSGRVVYNSMTSELYIYPAAKKVTCDAIHVMSADNIMFEVFPSLTYRIDSPVEFFKNRLCVFDREKLQMKPETYEEFENRMNSCIRIAYAEVSREYSLDSLVRHCLQFTKDVSSTLNTYKENGISVDIVQTGINPPKDWAEARMSLRDAENEIARLQKELERQIMIKETIKRNI